MFSQFFDLYKLISETKNRNTCVKKISRKNEIQIGSQFDIQKLNSQKAGITIFLSRIGKEKR